MKINKPLISIFFFLLSSNFCISQKTDLEISCFKVRKMPIVFNLDTEKQEIANNFNLYFILSNDTFYADIQDTVAILPKIPCKDSLINLVFSYKDYKVSFNLFTANHFNEFLTKSVFWIFGIDNFPYEDGELTWGKRPQKESICYFEYDSFNFQGGIWYKPYP